ncbi:unnamed protein product [Cercospora beticola]|nr:unnamed protein product [Cercospora beticola]
MKFDCTFLALAASCAAAQVISESEAQQKCPLPGNDLPMCVSYSVIRVARGCHSSPDQEFKALCKSKGAVAKCCDVS